MAKRECDDVKTLDVTIAYGDSYIHKTYNVEDELQADIVTDISDTIDFLNIEELD